MHPDDAISQNCIKRNVVIESLTERLISFFQIAALAACLSSLVKNNLVKVSSNIMYF